MNRTAQLLALPPVAMLALVRVAETSSQAAVHASRPAMATTRSASSTPATCRTSALSVRLGAANGAAGSTYRPIVFTNTSRSACTLFGYPGVSFVAPHNGHQVGAAATRNRQHASRTIMLRPGAHASALLQIVDPHSYPAARCHLVAVSGLRVYPPGAAAAAYVPFGTSSKACSTQVGQLSVESTVSGSKGT